MRHGQGAQKGGCGTGIVVMLAALVVVVPLVACFLLPQTDIPGRISWMLRRGTTGQDTSLIPNDGFTTGSLAAVFLFFNIASVVFLGLALDARSRVRSRSLKSSVRNWVALVCVLMLYAGLGFCASKECAVVGRGGFATQTLCYRVTVHRWPQVVEMRRLHNMRRLPGRQIDGGGSSSAPQSLQYKVLFADGALWESADSENWAWPIIVRAMRRASEWSHVPIKDYRRPG